MAGSSGTDSTGLTSTVLAFLRTSLQSPGKCGCRLCKFMMFCLAVQSLLGYVRQTQGLLLCVKVPSFVLWICRAGDQFQNGKIYQEF